MLICLIWGCYVDHILAQKNNYMTKKNVTVNEVFYIKANFSVIAFNKLF